MDPHVSQNPPRILDVLALGLSDAAEAARAALRAQAVVLHLAPEAQSLGLRLAATGLTLADEDWQPATHPLQPLPLPEGAPTDLIRLVLSLVAPDGAPLGLLELQGVPTGWETRDLKRGLERIARLISRNLLALLAGPALVADPMVRLVARLGELDDTAVSHTLGGLLRVLSGVSPNRVEALAMQISGLVDATPVRSGKISLTEAAQALLDDAGIGRATTALADMLPETAPTDPVATPAAPSRLAPFARLRLAEEDFDIAEVASTGHFWFRRAGGSDWSALANRAADGWTAVGAEVLAQTRDVVMEFARMSMIRRRDLPTEEIAEAYDLNGVIWWLREGETGPEARLDGKPWQSVVLANEGRHRDRALAALYQLAPEVLDRHLPAARDWVNRMAHAVQVSPLAIPAGAA